MSDKLFERCHFCGGQPVLANNGLDFCRDCMEMAWREWQERGARISED